MRIKDLNIGHRGKTLVSGISFETEPGEFILLCGPNGSGKSTLLRALAGKDAIMVPTGVPKVKGFTLREFIATTLYSESDWRGRISPAMASDISKSLESLGISSLADRDISTLSDGEFQKGCIASALSRHAKTLLLDEPTSFLDVDNKSLILQALRDIARSTGTTVIMASHDLAPALSCADRVFGITADHRFLASSSRLSDSGLSASEVISACFTTYPSRPAGTL